MDAQGMPPLEFYFTCLLGVILSNTLQYVSLSSVMEASSLFINATVKGHSCALYRTIDNYFGVGRNVSNSC